MFKLVEVVFEWLKCQNLSLLIDFQNLKIFKQWKKGYCLMLCQTGVLFWVMDAKNHSPFRGHC